MKLFRNIQILLWIIVPIVSVAQETTVHGSRLLPRERDETVYRDYIPYYYQNPIEVNINLFFIQKDNGTGNFQKDDLEHQQLWDEILANVSKRFMEIQDSKSESCFAWKDPFSPDSRIRFKFNRYYLKTNKYWNWKPYGESAFGIDSTLDTLKYELEKRSDIPLGISVFFTENGDVFDEYKDVVAFGDTVSAKYANFAYTSMPRTDYISKICMPDIYCKFLWTKHILPKNDALEGRHTTWESDTRQLIISSTTTLLAHELGHALNLAHSCVHYKNDSCRDALMSPSGQPEYSHVYIPPTEIGRMHHALMSPRLSKVVSDDIPIAGTMTITHDLEWDIFRCYADLNITQSGSVDMYGAIRMPKKSTIEVGGKLYLMTCNIQCAKASDSWQGIIRVKRGGLLYLENVTISNYDIVMEPGSTLLLRAGIEFKNGHKMVIGDGVYVCVHGNFIDKSTSKSYYVNGSPETVLKNGMAAGITSKYEISCTMDGWRRFLSRCMAIEDTLYLQNQTLKQEETFVAKTILIGNSVNGNQTKGDVVIKSPAKATFIYQDRILFDKGFRCESGGSYKALQY